MPRKSRLIRVAFCAGTCTRMPSEAGHGSAKQRANLAVSAPQCVQKKNLRYSYSWWDGCSWVHPMVMRHPVGRDRGPFSMKLGRAKMGPWHSVASHWRVSLREVGPVQQRAQWTEEAPSMGKWAENRVAESRVVSDRSVGKVLKSVCSHNSVTNTVSLRCTC